MPENTSKTYLFTADAATGLIFTKLVDITSYPDVFTPPAKLQVTTLSNTQHVYIPDIADVPDMTFGALYSDADYDTVAALAGAQTKCQLQFGDAGVNGKFDWTGDIFVTPKGGAVGAPREMEITCYPSTEIVKAV